MVIQLEKIVEILDKISTSLHIPPIISIVFSGIFLPTLVYRITTLSFIEAFNTNLSTWAPIITALIYLGSLIYISKGKPNKINICSMLVMHSMNNHKLLQGSIFKSLNDDMPEFHFVTPMLFARLFYNYITSINNNSYIKNFYMYCICRRSKSSLIVGGDIRCINDQNKLLYKFDIDFINLSSTGEKLYDYHIYAFSETVHSFNSIKTVIELYIRFMQEMNKPHSYDTLVNTRKLLQKIAEIEKSGHFANESIKILSPAAASTIRKFFDFAQNSNPPNYSQKLELWMICDLIIRSNLELPIEAMRFYHNFVFESHDNKHLTFVAEHFTTQSFNYNDIQIDRILFEIEKVYCYLILGHLEKSMDTLKNVYKNASFESILYNFTQNLSQPQATEYIQLLYVLYNICKGDKKAQKKFLKSLSKQNANYISTQILNQIQKANI